MKKMMVSNEMSGNDGRLDVSVKFNDGTTYKLAFCNADYVKAELAGSGNGCVAIPALIILDVVSMKKVKEVLQSIYNSGYFDSLNPIGQ